ncbi:MAG: hypothetical protein AAGG01_15865, partial [Planctomycetota bacterium]
MSWFMAGMAAPAGLGAVLGPGLAGPADEGSDGPLPRGLKILYETPMQSFRIRRELFLDLWRQWPEGAERARAAGLAGSKETAGELLRCVARHYGLPLD